MPGSLSLHAMACVSSFASVGALQHQRCSRCSSSALAQFLFKGEILVQFSLTDTSFLAQTLLKKFSSIVLS